MMLRHALATSSRRARRTASLATLPDQGDDLLDAVHSVDDFQRLAETLLDRPLYEYLASGSGDEATLRDNRAAFGRYALRPRALRPPKPAPATADALPRLEPRGIGYCVGASGGVYRHYSVP